MLLTKKYIVRRKFGKQKSFRWRAIKLCWMDYSGKPNNIMYIWNLLSLGFVHDLWLENKPYCYRRKKAKIQRNCSRIVWKLDKMVIVNSSDIWNIRFLGAHKTGTVESKKYNIFRLIYWIRLIISVFFCLLNDF